MQEVVGSNFGIQQQQLFCRGLRAQEPGRLLATHSNFFCAMILLPPCQPSTQRPPFPSLHCPRLFPAASHAHPCHRFPPFPHLAFLASPCAPPAISPHPNPALLLPSQPPLCSPPSLPPVLTPLPHRPSATPSINSSNTTGHVCPTRPTLPLPTAPPEDGCYRCLWCQLHNPRVLWAEPYVVADFLVCNQNFSGDQNLSLH